MHTFILVLRGEYIFDENGIGLGFGDCDGDISYSPIACRLVLCFLLTLLGVAPFVLLFAEATTPTSTARRRCINIATTASLWCGRSAALSLIKSYLFLQFSLCLDVQRFDFLFICSTQAVVLFRFLTRSFKERFSLYMCCILAFCFLTKISFSSNFPLSSTFPP